MTVTDQKVMESPEGFVDFVSVLNDIIAAGKPGSKVKVSDMVMASLPL